MEEEEIASEQEIQPVATGSCKKGAGSLLKSEAKSVLATQD